MFWAVDIGNTQTVVGVWVDGLWKHTWRLATNPETTEDELASMLSGLCNLARVPFQASGLMVASVVPRVDDAWKWLASKHLGVTAGFLRNGQQVGVPVTYDPPHAVGADRIANALAALALVEPPLVIVDFGTATTLDCVDAKGNYVGGAIMPGVMLGLQALNEKTAKLPSIALHAPEKAVGRNTVEAIESGVVLGYAGAVEGLLSRVKAELGPTTRVFSTGGQGKVFASLCPSIEKHEKNLTLDGLRIAFDRLG
ncbi:MAG: type III pantothenate kinase [Armatimonadota bacterium]